MSYADIDNLYKNQDILMFKECYAMEKIHGTSAHVSWSTPTIPGATEVEQVAFSADRGSLAFFSGGEKHENFVKLFDEQKLKDAFVKMGQPEVTVYGEAYGGKCQGMSKTYGKELKFVVFEVRIGKSWLCVPNAHKVCDELGLEFVHYRKIPTDLLALDAERDAPSEQAFRNGCAVREDPSTHKKREGIVLRSLIEVRKNNGERIIAKHKRDDFQERKTPQQILDPAKLKVLTDAQAIADEWVTAMRLVHVIDHIKAEVKRDVSIEDTGIVCKEMVADIGKEAVGEIIESKETRVAISKRAAGLFKEWLKLN